MSHPILFRRPAHDEYLEAIRWYEDQGPGLGLEFENEIERLLTIIADHPKRYPMVLRDTREVIANRFPYCVYYRLRAGRVIVLSVFHTSRDPVIWQDRV